MSKYVKNLISDYLGEQLTGADDVLLVNVVGMTANSATAMRRELRSKNIRLIAVKNSLVRRATDDSPLGKALEGLTGPMALVWGGEDVVSTAKEVVRLSKEEEFAPFEPRGGVMDGAPLTAEQVKEISKWPSRGEQLSLLVGQMLSPGASLSSQLIGPGGGLASQISQKADGPDDGELASQIEQKSEEGVNDENQNSNDEINPNSK